MTELHNLACNIAPERCIQLQKLYFWHLGDPAPLKWPKTTSSTWIDSGLMGFLKYRSPSVTPNAPEATASSEDYVPSLPARIPDVNESWRLYTRTRWLRWHFHPNQQDKQTSIIRHRPVATYKRQNSSRQSECLLKLVQHPIRRQRLSCLKEVRFVAQIRERNIQHRSSQRLYLLWCATLHLVEWYSRQRCRL